MNPRLASVALVAVLLLTGCASGGADGVPAASGTGNASEASTSSATPTPTPVEPLDLSGEWKQTNSNSDTSYQSATISGDQILINWVNTADSTTAIYWAGTYVAPAAGVTTFTWDSVNDTTQTENALLASSDPTKTFTYDDGVLKYELTAMGVTMTVEMARQ